MQKVVGSSPIIRFTKAPLSWVFVLSHTFGSLAINRASIVQVQAWIGHADVKTTMRYLHHKGQADEAALLAGAFGA